MIRRSFLASLTAGVAALFGVRKVRNYFSAELGDLGRVYDANGNEIDIVISCWLEEGRIETYALDGQGNYLWGNDGDLQRNIVYHPAPLAFIPFT